MLKRRCATALATFILALTLPLSAVSVQAESACKGLESSPCQQKDNCSWVKPYTRKDGVKVSGHCKSKPGKSSKSDSKKKTTSEKKTESKE